MENCFGVLSVFTFVTLPDGREKRANLASIGCEYSERKSKLLDFKMANPNLSESMHIGAEFKFSEHVHTY